MLLFSLLSLSLSLSLSLCVCVCVRVCGRVCVCVQSCLHTLSLYDFVSAWHAACTCHAVMRWVYFVNCLLCVTHLLCFHHSRHKFKSLVNYKVCVCVCVCVILFLSCFETSDDKVCLLNG